MAEVQRHGFDFEEWIRHQFFGGYEGTYMQKWDIPPNHNIDPSVPAQFHNLPVSIKTAKLGSPIGLGDVLRQRQIDHDFLMIVGFWEQWTPTEKRIVHIGHVVFTSSAWQALWGDLMPDAISEIDRVVKNMGEHYSTVRRKAQLWKASSACKSSIIVINPKIDSKTQRRIQCSLPYGFFRQYANSGQPHLNSPELWGRDFPTPIRSSPRTFNLRTPF
jgi:hypothetical protein